MTTVPYETKAMLDEEYRADPAMNWSWLKKILDCPLAFKENTYPDSSAMKLGTLIHKVLLEGFDNYINFDVIAAPHLEGLCDDKGKPYKNPKASTKGKEILSVLGKQHAGSEFCSQDEIDLLDFYKDAFKKDPRIKVIMEGAQTEVAAFREVGGVQCKAKIDILTKNNKVWDLKSAADVNPRAFSRAIFQRDYHSQVAFYAHLANAFPAGIIIVSTVKPFQYSIVEFFEDVLEHAKVRIEKAIERLLKARSEKVFPGYGNYKLELPAYLKNESLDEEEEDLF